MHDSNMMGVLLPLRQTLSEQTYQIGSEPKQNNWRFMLIIENIQISKCNMKALYIFWMTLQNQKNRKNVVNIGKHLVIFG